MGSDDSELEERFRLRREAERKKKNFGPRRTAIEDKFRSRKLMMLMRPQSAEMRMYKPKKTKIDHST